MPNTDRAPLTLHSEGLHVVRVRVRRRVVRHVGQLRRNGLEEDITPEGEAIHVSLNGEEDPRGNGRVGDRDGRGEPWVARPDHVRVPLASVVERALRGVLLLVDDDAVHRYGRGADELGSCGRQGRQATNRQQRA